MDRKVCRFRHFCGPFRLRPTASLTFRGPMWIAALLIGIAARRSRRLAPAQGRGAGARGAGRERARGRPGERGMGAALRAAEREGAEGQQRVVPPARGREVRSDPEHAEGVRRAHARPRDGAPGRVLAADDAGSVARRPRNSSSAPRPARSSPRCARRTSAAAGARCSSSARSRPRGCSSTATSSEQESATEDGRQAPARPDREAARRPQRHRRREDAAPGAARRARRPARRRAARREARRLQAPRPGPRRTAQREVVLAAVHADARLRDPVPAGRELLQRRPSRRIRSCSISTRAPA